MRAEFNREIKLPDSLRPIPLDKEKKPKQIEKGAWTPEQTNLANILQEAIQNSQDSLDPHIHQVPLSEEVLKSSGVSISSDGIVSHKGNQFKLPSGFKVSQEGDITYSRPQVYAEKPSSRPVDNMSASSSTPPPIPILFPEKEKPLPPGSPIPAPPPPLPKPAASVPAPVVTAKATPPVSSTQSSRSSQVTQSQASSVRPGGKTSDTQTVDPAAVASIARGVTTTQTLINQFAAQSSGSLGSAVSVQGAKETDSDAEQQQQKGRSQAAAQSEFKKETDPSKIKNVSGGGAPGKKK